MPRRLLLFVAAAALAATSCSSNSTATEPAGDGAPTGEITVSAAASLTEAFTLLGEQFEAANPGTTVTFTFASSSSLAQQVLDGAPADVFASANVENMTKLTEADLAVDPATFARNQLVIITAPGNPEGIESLADLADAGVVSLCGEDAPCGTFAARLLERAGVTIPESSVTRGQNAKATLTAVSEGDAVAGIVYVTDAVAAGESVDAVEIDGADEVIATYPIAALSSSANPELARAFAEFVASAEGTRSLEDVGFLPPS